MRRIVCAAVAAALVIGSLAAHAQNPKGNGQSAGGSPVGITAAKASAAPVNANVPPSNAGLTITAIQPAPTVRAGNGSDPARPAGIMPTVSATSAAGPASPNAPPAVNAPTIIPAKAK